MRIYIVLLLITGTVWAQTGLDKLVLKNGTFLFNTERTMYTKKKLFWTFLIVLFGIFLYSSYSNFSRGMFSAPIPLP